VSEGVSDAILNGLKARCPKCGKGPLYDGYLKIAPACRVCGATFEMADVGDGAAVFVMFIVGALVVPLAFVLQFSAHAPVWATMSIAAAAAVVLSLALLRIAKAILFALQWTHKAEEGKLRS
jgi:uncharacterized protein (DUF983 family)